MTFEEWYNQEGWKIMASGKSVKECLYEAYVNGYSFGVSVGRSEAKDKDYEV